MLKKILDTLNTKIVSYTKGKYTGRLKLTFTLIFNKGGIRNVRLNEEKEYDLKSQS